MSSNFFNNFNFKEAKEDLRYLAAAWIILMVVPLLIRGLVVGNSTDDYKAIGTVYATIAFIGFPVGLNTANRTYESSKKEVERNTEILRSLGVPPYGKFILILWLKCNIFLTLIFWIFNLVAFIDGLLKT